MAEYYAQRATAGLIVTGSAQVSAQGIATPRSPGIHTTKQAAGWAQIVDAVHAAGSTIFIQIYHAGRISHPLTQKDGAIPVAPSAIRAEGQWFTPEGLKPLVRPRALGTDEIPGIVEQFREGARLAKEAGFDGVEILGGGGWLLDQFICDKTNKRSDDYGGGIENRLRLSIEATRAVVEIWGPERVGFQITPIKTFNDIADSDPITTFTTLARELGRIGVVYLLVAEATGASLDKPLNADEDAGLEAEFDKDTFLASRPAIFPALRKAFDGTYIANTDYDRDRANAVIEAGQADLVAFARAYLANPDLPRRHALGARLNEPDILTFYWGEEKGYTDYLFLDE